MDMVPYVTFPLCTEECSLNTENASPHTHKHSQEIRLSDGLHRNRYSDAELGVPTAITKKLTRFRERDNL
jgi:hypothetical protein